MQLSETIENIYGWFSGFHNDAIGKALEVFTNPDTGDVIWTSKYPLMMLVTAIIAFVIAFAYYIWPIDHPKFKSWWSWLIMLVVNCGLSLLAGWHLAHVRMKLVLEHRESWEEITGRASHVNADTFDCLGMGLSNMMIGVLIFIFFSLILTFFSTNAKYSPFTK